MTAGSTLVPVAQASSRRARTGSIAMVAIVYLVVASASAVYPLLSPMSIYGPITVPGQALRAVGAMLWLAVLLVAMVRDPAGRLWKLILMWFVADSAYALSFVPSSIVWTTARVLEVIAIAVFVHLLLAFPSGRLHDRYDRRVVGFTYLFAAVSTLAVHLVWPSSFACAPDCVRNVLVVWPDWELFTWLQRVLTLGLVLVTAPLALGGLWRHWRAASPVSRRALLPLVVAAPLLAVGLSIDYVSVALDWKPGIDFFAGPSGEVVRRLVPLVLPAGLLLGILQARLSRGRIAGLVVELGRGVPVGGLRDVLARTLGDPTLELAFAAPSGDGFVDAGGRSVDLPTANPGRMVTRLERDGELLGVLVHDPAIEAEDPGLVEAVGNAARLALENERLAAEVRAQLEEVRASRARIVETADAERRRIERDLHDGAQQRLVALAVRLQLAKQHTTGAEQLLDEATAELQTAIGEVRGLARGVHPTILTEAGLRAAVDALAERTPLPVAVDVPERRYPAQVEATAYFVIAEALTNVARHADATEARVSLRDDGRRLVVAVSDDGAGGADPTGGSGLRGLVDRLAAAGGTLTVTSPPGRGTTVRADLPTADAHPARPTDAPEHDAGQARRGAVLAVRATPVGRAEGGDGRRATPDPVRLMVAVGAAIGLLAVAAAISGLQQRSPEDGRAEEFGRPFVYRVPGGSGIRLEALSDRLHVLRRPDGDRGISIWIVDDLLVDPCDAKGPVDARPPGAAGLIEALRSIERLRVEEAPGTTVDGRSATRIDLSVDGSSGCRVPEPGARSGLALWRDGSAEESTGIIHIAEGERVRLIVLDVEGATVAIEIWARQEFDDWLPIAASIVDSIRFLHRGSGG